MTKIMKCKIKVQKWVVEHDQSQCNKETSTRI